MKINTRKTMRGLWICLILGTVAGGMTSCSTELIDAEQDAKLITKLESKRVFESVTSFEGLVFSGNNQVQLVQFNDSTSCYQIDYNINPESTVLTSYSDTFAFRHFDDVYKIIQTGNTIELFLNNRYLETFEVSDQYKNFYDCI